MARLRQIGLVLVACLCAILIACVNGCAKTLDADTADEDEIDVLALAGCAPQAAVASADGIRRLALVVGVGDYAHPDVPDLAGPISDARQIYQLLTAPNGYGFPVENVCLLLDEQAKTARFRQAFEKSLAGRVASDKDVAVLYFAGHGSQARDRNGDEADGWDETLMLQDARTGDAQDLRDDQLNEMLAALYAKTTNVTVILDSCNSGTATRAPTAGTATARFFEPAAEQAQPAGQAVPGDGAGGLASPGFPRMNILSAAADGTAALEIGGHGIFTSALVRVLSDVNEGGLTYAQVARQVPPLVAADSPQVPYFQGDLGRPVFSNTYRTQPVAWQVVEVAETPRPGEPPLQLGGPPLPGIDVGAEFRIYDGAVQGNLTRDPAASKATVVVTSMQGLTAGANLLAVSSARQPMRPGDLAVLIRPADSYLKLRVRLRPEGEEGGLTQARAVLLSAAIQANADADMLIDVTPDAGDFELSVQAGRLQLRGPENHVRNTYTDDSQVADSLWRHARQRALLQLRGEGGDDFQDQSALLARLVPVDQARQHECARGEWMQADANQEQRVPLCHRFNLEVALAPDTPKPLLIGALILSNDGSIYALPSDSRTVRLQPGEVTRFEARGETFVGKPPLHALDRVMVFGTQETNPVAWGAFTQTVAARGTRKISGALHAAIERYLKPGTRAAAPDEDIAIEDSTWTMSAMSMRVVADPDLPPGSGQDCELPACRLVTPPRAVSARGARLPTEASR